MDNHRHVGITIVAMGIKNTLVDKSVLAVYKDKKGFFQHKEIIAGLIGGETS